MKTTSYIRNFTLMLSLLAVVGGGLVAKLVVTSESPVPAKAVMAAAHVLQLADGQETHGKTGG